MSRKASRSNQQILEEASTWFVVLRGQDLGGLARKEFHDWIKRSPEHIRAYLEIASTYADIPAPKGGRTPPELIAKARSSPDANVLPLKSGAIAVEGLKPPPSIGRRLAYPVTLVASVLLVAFIGTWWYAQRNTYATAIGEQRSITLNDGSIVELNARSKVRVAFDDRQRDVELLEGQALFRVAKDHSRPFVVRAGVTSVRAVGTQFDVYRRTTGTTVTVLEGRVAVLSSTLASGQVAVTEPARRETPQPASTIPEEHKGEILLSAGEQATVTGASTDKSQRANIAAATAWTQRQLIFDGTPLSEVVEEFRRYSSRHIVIDAPDLANLKISGQYTSASPESLLRFLSLQKGVVITEVDGTTHIQTE
jgi:transmembrane sensor